MRSDFLKRRFKPHVPIPNLTLLIKTARSTSKTGESPVEVRLPQVRPIGSRSIPPSVSPACIRSVYTVYVLYTISESHFWSDFRPFPVFRCLLPSYRLKRNDLDPKRSEGRFRFRTWRPASAATIRRAPAAMDGSAMAAVSTPAMAASSHLHYRP